MIFGLLLVLVSKKGGVLIIKGKEKGGNTQLLFTLILNITTLLAFLFMIMSIQIMNPALYSLIDTYAYPIFVALFGAFIFKDKVSSNLYISLPFAFFGLWFLSTGGRVRSLDLEFEGILFCLVASLFFAISILITKKLLAFGWSPHEIIFIRFPLTSIILSIFVLQKHEISSLSYAQHLIILILSFAGYVIPFILSFIALKNVSPIKFAYSVLLIPVFSFIFSSLLFGFTGFDYTQLMGGILIVISIVLFNIPDFGNFFSSGRMRRI